MQRELLHCADISVFLNWAVLDHAGDMDTENPQHCVIRARAEDATQSGGLLQRGRGGVLEEGRLRLRFGAGVGIFQEAGKAFSGSGFLEARWDRSC